MTKPLSCRIFGCRWSFTTDGSAIAWTCLRGCGAHGRHECRSLREARCRALRLQRAAPSPPVGLLAALSGSGWSADDPVRKKEAH